MSTEVEAKDVSLTMWVATPWKVEECEVQKVTDHFVMLKGGRREAIDTEYSHWRNSRNNAVMTVISDLSKKVLEAENHLEFAKNKLAEYQKEFLP